jgi:hypothetical protein
MKIKIKDRIGSDLFFYLDLVEESRDRANEWAITEFVEFDGESATLDKFLALTGEQQAILTGRVFTLNTKGVKQDDDLLTCGDIKVKRKDISHDVMTTLQLKIQRLKERGDTSTTALIKSSIQLFYFIDMEDLDTHPYQVGAFMFNYINSFLTRVSDSSNEFDFDDE